MELTKINNSKFKWIVWWGQYSIVRVDNEYDEQISVVDHKIYFTDGTISERYESNETALIVATTLFNTEHGF
tara:strand:- start:115 stop:330 length:216 start_codon:yes stop_codon:yes gene_type:complete